MTRKCKFDVEVTYNPDFFAEGEIRETLKKAIRDLNDNKEKKFGRSSMIDPGRTNKGLHGTVTQQETFCATDSTESFDLVETLVSLSRPKDDDEEPSLVLPDTKMEELVTQVRSTIKD